MIAKGFPFAKDFRRMSGKSFAIMPGAGRALRHPGQNGQAQRGAGPVTGAKPATWSCTTDSR
jgi:hypothetical protein